MFYVDKPRQLNTLIQHGCYKVIKSDTKEFYNVNIYIYYI